MSIRYEDAILEQVTTTNQVVYTCPEVAKNAQIIFTNCTNASGADTNLTIYIIKAGDSADVSNIYLDEKQILASKSDALLEISGAILKAGDSIEAVSGSDNELNLKLGIKELY